jgi:hypothetical protein
MRERLSKAGTAFVFAALWYGAGEWLDAREAAWHATLVEVPVRYASTQKVVTSGKVKHHRIENVTHLVKYSYTYEGKDYEGEDEVDWDPQYQAALHPTVKVDPNAPSVSTLSGPEKFWSFVGLVLAAFSGLAGINALSGSGGDD